MARLKLSDIIIPGASLKPVKLKMTKEVKELIEQTRKQQEAILKLKEVDYEQLKQRITI